MIIHFRALSCFAPPYYQCNISLFYASLYELKIFFFRPAFLEEFEKLEAELQTLYQEYVTRTRCISYLEQQHEEATLIEQERMQQRQVLL